MVTNQLGTRSEKQSFQKDCKTAVFERSPKEGVLWPLQRVDAS